MTAQPQSGPASSKATAGAKSERKPWHKKSPVQVILEQIDKVRDNVYEKEEELKQAKKQLQKLEEAKKLLESS